MGYKLNKNGVLSGSINSFCLACDVFLKTEPDADVHINSLSHKKTLAANGYLEKFKDDYIRKFKTGYYCEFCNILLPIAAKVAIIHITEDEHKNKKGALLLKPSGNKVVAFGNIVIEESAWHGFMEEMCSICNSEFDDQDKHKKDLGHSLNLVLKPVKFGGNNAIYRHIDDSAIQCLTCNQLLAPNAMDKHFSDAEHQQLYKNCENKDETVEHFAPSLNSEKARAPDNPVVVNGAKDSKKTDHDNNNNNHKTDGNQKAKILESISKYQSKGMNINLETETAFCKKCAEVINFDVKEIESHIENHASAKIESKYPSNLDKDLNKLDINDKTSENKSDDENDDTYDTASAITGNGSEKNEKDKELDYAKENNITLNPESNNAYCRTCEVRLPSSFKSLKEHVAGGNHKSRRAKVDKDDKVVEDPKPSTRTLALSKMEIRHFVNIAFGVSGLFCRDTVVNEEYCMSSMGFWIITQINSRYRCHVCDVYLPPNTSIEMHAQTKFHAIKSGLVPIITSEKTEFIREIRPGLFHCGFCNLIVSSWNEMKNHLKCTEHKTKKLNCKRRLEAHLPNLQEYKQERTMHTMQLLWLLNQFG